MTTTTQHDGASPYEIGRTYLVTEVFGWWLQDLREKPKWFPVICRLHEDETFFDLHEHHYHVDPRFLSVRHETEARTKSVRVGGRATQDWHRSAQEIIARFPMPNDRSWHFVIKNGRTHLAPNVETEFTIDGGVQTWRRPRDPRRLSRTEAWGRSNIATRRVERVA